ncbi:MAG: 3-hydroxyacyl-[acyl-carrier-protein] dehydratase FabZ, partial [Tritonibacter mobilis]|nr:3-hydroxyacyl-[acyl-carrier-protein] dehydratase FabZ [Tritonibacter mobilis]
MSADANPDLKSADIGLIQQILPHRYPFLLVDK